MNEFERYKYKNEFSLSFKLQRLVWNLVYITLFRLTPSWVMHGWRIFLLRSFGAQIGQGCKISPSCKIWAPWNLSLQSYVCLADNVDCYSVSPITIGSKVTVSQGSFICTASHAIDTLDRPLVHKPIFIDDHVWVCAEAFVGPGVTIGKGAIVGARSVVSKNVDEWTVVAGNPAVFIKKRVLKVSEQDEI